MLVPVVLAAVLGAVASIPYQTTPGSFKIENDQFLLNGKPFQIISGELHYHRIHPAYWEDRILRLKAMGLNTIQTYVPWNVHETERGVFRWTGDEDVEHFLDLIQKAGMHVLLRPGPFVCAEWEFGGFPYWLMATRPAMKLRTYDDQYIAEVDRWWAVVLPRLSPYLITQGGPILMIQLENEYGFVGDVQKNALDRKYLVHLLNETRKHVGTDIILYTTDPALVVHRGSLSGPDVFTTVDFGADSSLITAASFYRADMFNPPGMKARLCSEFYTGWVVNWGDKAVNHSSSAFASALKTILVANSSVNLYMAHGGTNFGYTAGAGVYPWLIGGYKSDITSYDYNAPVGEAGDHTIGSDGKDKFVAIRDVITAVTHVTPPAEPAFIPKAKYDTISLKEYSGLFANLSLIASDITYNHPYPLPMEMVGQGYGFILYSHVLPATTASGQAVLKLCRIRDKGYVWVQTGKDISLIGTVESTGSFSFDIPLSDVNRTLYVMAENRGRTNFHGFGDDWIKGLSCAVPEATVTWNKRNLTGDWTVHSLPLRAEEIAKIPFLSQLRQVVASGDEALPGFYRGQVVITANATADTFLVTKGWGRGVAWVNGFNLGRYWEAKGPQHSLYIPAPLLRLGSNEIVLFELDKAHEDLTLSFSDHMLFR